MAGTSNDSHVFEGALMGGALLMTLWGALVVVGDLFLRTELVPHSEEGAVAILVLLSVIGGVLGAGVGKRAG
jgi:hypothetical protein